jgi:hypothetical protein
MKTHRPHSFRLALATLVAVLSAFTVAAIFTGRDVEAHSASGHHAATSSHHAAKISHGEFILRQEMRRLWEEHVTWTRLAVLSLTTDAPDTQATVGRLLRNQTDIGNAVKPYYGAAAGNRLTSLLREHILIAADLIAAARTGVAASVAAQQARWTANADQIAALLNGANPRFWKLGAMKAMMHEHLGLTTAEVVARLRGDWPADVVAYDRIHLQGLHMADMLARGIVHQFPRRFR